MPPERLMHFQLESKYGLEPLSFPVRRMINAGFSGRDQKAVQTHIQELLDEGIPAPEKTPVFFPITCQNLGIDNYIEVTGNKTSGEVEYVILLNGDGIYIGVGSDHSDRSLETTSMVHAKQVCPNIMSKSLWDFYDLEDHWDSLCISSWVRGKEEDEEILYQKDQLSAIMHPVEIISHLRSKLKSTDLEGTVLFSGTIPVIAPKVIYGEIFRCELRDNVLNRTLTCEYSVENIGCLFGSDKAGPL